MSKGFAIIIVKIILSLIAFIVIIIPMIDQLGKSMTTSEAANNALNKELFTQDCLEAGIENYYCATPDSDSLTYAVEDPYADKRWDGCPNSQSNDYKYLTNYGGCQQATQEAGVEQAAYCCTKITPKKCELPNLRTCVNKILSIDNANTCPGGNYYDDGCDKDCSETENGHSKCAKHVPAKNGPGTYCSQYPACCGKNGNRACAYDCPPEYPTLINKPELSGPEWGCNNGVDACCQK